MIFIINGRSIEVCHLPWNLEGNSDNEMSKDSGDSDSKMSKEGVDSDSEISKEGILGMKSHVDV